MAEAKSGSRATWPKVVLWVLVIIFGLLYLNAMRDRGAGGRDEALVPPDPDLVAMTGSRADDKGADAVDVVTDRDAAAPALASFDPIAESPAPAGPQADEVAERALAEPERLDSEQAGADVRPVADPDATSSASREAEAPGRSIPADPAPMTEPAVTGAAVADDAERSAPRADPGDLSLAERRARLLADYERLLLSVEAERRQIWEEMNRLGGADWPYPYPAPPWFGGPPGRVPGHHWPGP
ncbi:hypothetical protein ABC977_04205 [Thioalkalicoccus limnaeus]|uniref:Uncharacterized protein n=1 Tax=Thioalkalicoccus limnaeus TaxID=120681 RepID=A0ABV4BE18_9GAMM